MSEQMVEIASRRTEMKAKKNKVPRKKLNEDLLKETRSNIPMTCKDIED